MIPDPEQLAKDKDIPEAIDVDTTLRQQIEEREATGIQGVKDRDIARNNATLFKQNYLTTVNTGLDNGTRIIYIIRSNSSLAECRNITRNCRVCCANSGYESRVDGTLFVNTAEDELSPSYGLAQANVSSMSPAIYMAFKELGVELPGLTDEQEEQLLTNKYIDNDLRPFTEEQTSFVINWFQNTAKLNDHAVVLKYMIQQKMMEGAETEVEAINELYPLTVSKFNDTSNQDAQAVKSQISGEVSSFYNNLIEEYQYQKKVLTLHQYKKVLLKQLQLQ